MKIRMEDIIQVFELGNRNVGHLSELIDALERILADCDYSQLFKNITSKDPGMGGPFGHVFDRINLIPGNHIGECREILLAVSKGTAGDSGFNSTIQKIKQHLVDCPITKTVVVVTDNWKKGMPNDHLLDLQRHHSRGVRFVFLLAVSNSLVPMPEKIHH